MSTLRDGPPHAAPPGDRDVPLVPVRVAAGSTPAGLPHLRSRRADRLSPLTGVAQGSVRRRAELELRLEAQVRFQPTIVGRPPKVWPPETNGPRVAPPRGLLAALPVTGQPTGPLVRVVAAGTSPQVEVPRPTAWQLPDPQKTAERRAFPLLSGHQTGTRRGPPGPLTVLTRVVTLRCEAQGREVPQVPLLAVPTPAT